MAMAQGGTGAQGTAGRGFVPLAWGNLFAQSAEQ